jgi:hypothetical protein
MALVFQYGSNCTAGRINGPKRLGGKAKDLGRAQTVEDFDIAFDVLSKTNGCAASNLIQTPGRKAWGVLYEISDEVFSRLKHVEGPRYEETTISVTDTKGEMRNAITFVVKPEDRRDGLATSAAYVSWIVYGLRDHGVPEDWVTHMIEAAVKTNDRSAADSAEQTRLIKTL